MASKPTDAPSGNGPAQFPGLGKEQTEAMLNMQKELAEAYEQASRAWLDRVKSEAELWSELASKLSATRSVPEAMAAYQASVTKRLQMAADDGRRMAEDCQALMQKFTQSLTGGLSAGRPGGST